MKKKLIPVVCLILSLYVAVAPPVHSDYTEIKLYSGNPEWTSH